MTTLADDHKVRSRTPRHPDSPLTVELQSTKNSEATLFICFVLSSSVHTTDATRSGLAARWQVQRIEAVSGLTPRCIQHGYWSLPEGYSCSPPSEFIHETARVRVGFAVLQSRTVTSADLCSIFRAAKTLSLDWVLPIVVRDLVGSYAICFGWEWLLYGSPLAEKLKKYKMNEVPLARMLSLFVFTHGAPC